jgi:hypothetical protein
MLQNGDVKARGQHMATQLSLPGYDPELEPSLASIPGG